MKSIIKTALTILTLACFSLNAVQGAKKIDAKLLKEAKISQADAEKTALAKVPNGKIKLTELEKEEGKLVWDIDISMPDSKNITAVLVDAKTGEVISTKIETPKDQEAEAKAEKAAKKKVAKGEKQ